MALLQSVSTRTRFSGFLRSSHALLGLFAVLCLAFSMTSSSPIINVGSFFLFVVLAGVVALRYAFKGPEQDRSQPSMIFTEAATHLTNIGPADLESSALLGDLVKVVAANRRKLPPPAGKVVDGEIVMLTDDQVREITKQDEVALKPTLPSYEGPSANEPHDTSGR